MNSIQTPLNPNLSPPPVITIPNVQLSLEQLLVVVRQLEPEARAKVAEALLAEDMERRLAQLIQRLANKVPVVDLTDAEIEEEVRAVRKQRP